MPTMIFAEDKNSPLSILFFISGLCSSRAQWPLAPNFCSRATRKSQIFHTNHMLGTLDFAVSEPGSLQFSLEHSLAYHTKAKSNDDKIAEYECLSLFMSGGPAAGHPRGGGLASATYGRYMYLSVCCGLYVFTLTKRYFFSYAFQGTHVLVTK